MFKKIIIFWLGIILLSSCKSKETEELLNELNEEVIYLNDQIGEKEKQIIILEKKMKTKEESYKRIITELEDESKRINEENESITEKLQELNIEINQLSDSNNQLINELEVKDNEMNFYNTIWFESDKLINIDKLKIMNIGINDTKEQVKQVLGNNYKESYWKNEHSSKLEGEQWIYEGIIINFLGDEAVEILAYGKNINTNFNVSIGDNYYKSIVKLSFSLDGYVSRHSINGYPNKGWFISDRDEVIILDSKGEGVKEGYVNMILIKRNDVMVD